MTTREPELNQVPPVPAAPKPESVGKRVREWFWRGAKLAEKRQTLPEPSARMTALAQRARSSADLALNCADLARNAEVARSAMTPAEPLETLAEATTSELYRQSAYWALSSLAARSDESAGTSYSDAIWDTLDEQLLLSVAGSEERAVVLRAVLRQGSFVYFAELPAAEQLALSVELRKLSELLLVKLDERTAALQAILLQRTGRLSLVLLLVLAIGGVCVWQRQTYDARNDLAKGKPWQASSKFDPGCPSPNQTCPESPQYFFHTQEEKDPTIEFDLGRVQQVSAVQVDNRLDGFTDRAIPLFVEISQDHKRWKTVARKGEDFTIWRATFAPASARWVRLRAHKVTFLHLSRVRILP